MSTQSKNLNPDLQKPSTENSPKLLGENVVDFLTVITRWRRFIVWFVMTVTVITTVVALLSPKWYLGTASVFPAEQTNLFSGFDGISSLVKNFSPGGRLASLTGPTEAERYIGILKSENALMRVIEKFNLTRVYEVTNFPRMTTIKELLGNVQFDIADEGTLQIKVYDKDPVRAADMANYFVQVLNDINSNLQAQNAKGNRSFIENRYNKNLEDVRKAEEALKSFQLKHGVIALPEQTEASIKAGATIYAQLAAKEIELSVLRRTLSSSHPNITSTQIEVDEIKRKLSEMNSGANLPDDQMKILVPFKQTPQLAADYIRLYREVEIQYKILQFLTPLFEQAKVEEQRNTPSVIVLDKASVPERKAKPKVALYTVLSFFISMLVSLLIIFSISGVQRLGVQYPDRLNFILNSIRSDWFGIRRFPWKSGRTK